MPTLIFVLSVLVLVAVVANCFGPAKLIPVNLVIFIACSILLSVVGVVNYFGG